MKIAVIALVKLEKDKLLHYNSQSLGLAKRMASQGCEVDVYSFERLENVSEKVSTVAPGVRLIQRDAPGIGGNTLRVTQYLKAEYESILCFSDIQIAYCGLDRWCERNRITLFPYVGVIRSSKENPWVRRVMDWVASRNVAKYQKRLVFAKTIPVKEELEARSVSAVLAPVGLDLSVLKNAPSETELARCKLEAGFRPEDKVLLFVGRLVEEKRPLALIELFARAREQDKGFQLCVIGDGHLRSEMRQRISELGLTDHVHHYPLLRNSDMWKFYAMADFSINLNMHEIFGMSILEAMYYRCIVVARRAPGPEMIIEHGRDGYLCASEAEILATITAPGHPALGEAAHRKIVEEFDWTRTSRIMLEAMKAMLSKTGPR